MTKRLTLVVGAGASKELGLPVGAELRTQIASLLNFNFEWDRQDRGDRHIVAALNAAVAGPTGRQGDINPYLEAAWRIRDAMPQAISIDNYIDNHQGDDKIELCGKLAITKSILDAERKGLIYTGREKRIDFESAEGCWLSPLWRLITESCRADDLPQRLASMTFVIFNYDRCIEHFLYHALQNYYRIGDRTAAALLNEVQFFHPYGSVGKLPWQGGSSVADFGDALSADRLLDNARQIKTFTEGTDPTSSEICAIQNAVADADNLLFLGFAYHKLNMQLISPKEVPARNHQARNFGTAIGLSNTDCAAISAEIHGMRGGVLTDTALRNDLSSRAIFGEYTRHISLV